ncbi:hypothetical protein GJ496_002051 [Pomphorhynchus laevis]|nr:hypothetical protein GJ496_002051 [Pomphorhynchus laevis]
MQFSKIFSFSHIDRPVITHLKNVYVSLLLSSIFACLGCALVLLGYIQVSIISVLGTFACIWYIIFTSNNHLYRQNIRLFSLFLLGFCSGINIGPILQNAISIDASLVLTALLTSSAIFLSFTLAALHANDRRYLMLEGLIWSGLSVLFFWNFASMFTSLETFQKGRMLLTLALMCMFVLFDTQLIITKREYGDTDFVRHSLDLFSDLLQIFRILLILSTKRESRKRNKSE